MPKRKSVPDSEKPGARGRRLHMVWRNVVQSLLHLAAAYSLVLTPKAKPLTLLWGKCRRRPCVPSTMQGAREVAAPQGTASNALRSHPTFSGPLVTQFSALWDGQVFLSRYFQLLPPLIPGLPE
jgi:hypothetical protein